LTAEQPQSTYLFPLTQHPAAPPSAQAPDAGTLLSGTQAERAREVILAIADDLRSYCRSADPDLQSGEANSLPPTLAGGEAGIAVFFAHLSREIPGRGFELDAANLLARAAEGAAEKRLGSGLYGGFTGIAWAIAHLQNEGFEFAAEYDLADIDEVVEGVLKLSPWRDHTDLISGLAGFGVYALERLCAPGGKSCAREVLLRLAEVAEHTSEEARWHTPPWLVPPHSRAQFPNGWYNVGVAHGVPGIVAVLSSLVEAGFTDAGEPHLLEEAVRWVLAQASPRGGRFRFPAYVCPGQEPSPSRAAWCYGDPGVGAALVLAGLQTGQPRWTEAGRDALASAAELPLAASGVQDAMLCHGSAGLAHLYARAARALRDDALATTAAEWYRHTLEMHRPGEGIGGYLYVTIEQNGPERVANPGLLEGTAGIGLALLAGVSSREPSWDRFLLTHIPLHPAAAARHADLGIR
jgi:lantibiotic modifying enzyme